MAADYVGQVTTLYKQLCKEITKSDPTVAMKTRGHYLKVATKLGFTIE